MHSVTGYIESHLWCFNILTTQECSLKTTTHYAEHWWNMNGNYPISRVLHLDAGPPPGIHTAAASSPVERPREEDGHHLAGPYIPSFDFGVEASTHKKAVVFRMKFQGSDPKVTLTTEELGSCNTKQTMS